LLMAQKTRGAHGAHHKQPGKLVVPNHKDPWFGTTSFPGCLWHVPRVPCDFWAVNNGPKWRLNHAVTLSSSCKCLCESDHQDLQVPSRKCEETWFDSTETTLLRFCWRL